MINDASVVIGGGNWGIKEADVLGYKLINDEYYAREIDFANSTAAGTYTDSTGVIRKAPYNLLQYSEQFDNGVWGKLSGSTVTANQATAPNGTLTADLITEGTSVLVYFALNTFRAGTYTQSYYAKKGTGDIFGMYFGSGFTARFNLTLGTIISATNTTATIQDVGNGWYRCTATSTPTADFYAGISYSNSSGLTVFAWGAQLVEGTEALPYFPTTNRLNVPRIDYRNADGSLSTVGRLLLEPQRTNLVTYSEQFDNASWLKTRTAVTANTTTAPNGTLTADTLTGVDTGGKYVIQQSSIISGSRYSVSIYAKKNTNNFIQLFAATATFGPNAYANFDLNNGVVGTVGAAATAIIEDAGNGWYRCIVTATSTVTTTANAIVVSLITSATSPPDEINTLTTSVFLWGAQLEAGTYPTTYIPTTNATVTRNADSASRTGVSSWIGQEEGTVFVEFSTANLENYTRRVFSLSDGTNSNQINLQIQASTTTLTFAVLNGVAVQALINTSTNFYTLGSTIKIAVAYKANDFVFYANGSQIGIDTSGTVPTCSQFRFADPLNSNNFVGGISQSVIYQTRLTNEQLSQITTL
jgi:hypothetical protein